MWYLYTIEFYSATKKNEILSFTGKWVELYNITVSEVSQVQKAKKQHVLSCIQIIVIKQMKQCYGTLVTLRSGHAQEG
jgi:hypothetical protein